MMNVRLGLTILQSCSILIRTNICFPKYSAFYYLHSAHCLHMGRVKWFRDHLKLMARKQSTFRKNQTLISLSVCTTIQEQKKTQVDKYEMDGDTPNVDTVFL